MSSPYHPTSDIEDAFSSNFPDYVPASPGKTYSSSLNNSFGVVPIVSPTLSLFHDDPLRIFPTIHVVPNYDNNRVNVESDLVESLINHDTSIVHSSKIDPILEEFASELAHIAPIPPGIVEADFDTNDDTSSDDDSF
ncbi:hypothetical protein Tco_1448093 [Tanacetum coccineum]